MTKIGIVGSRTRNSYKDFLIVSKLFFVIYNKNDIIVSGGCSKGGDRFAEKLADKFDIPITIFKADWSLGRHAGFLRNTDIAKESDILIACVAADRKGGTEDTIKKFKKFHSKGLVYIIEHPDAINRKPLI